METKPTDAPAESAASTSPPDAAAAETLSEAEIIEKNWHSPDAERLRKLLASKTTEERLRSMTPENRALYESIVKLREEIGPLDFDIVETLREIRDE